MKPRNFPARKLTRQIAAQNRKPLKDQIDAAMTLEQARNTRTKKRRGSN